METAYAAQLFQRSDTKLTSDQIASAEHVLRYTAEQLVDRAMDVGRPNDIDAQVFLMASRVAGQPIDGTGQWMFVANDGQRENFSLNMANTHPARVAEKEAIARYNLAVANGDITIGGYRAGANPLVPDVSECGWGDGKCIRNISDDINGAIYTGQLYPCYVADCIGNNFVNNDETNRLLNARSDRAMNDLLSTASWATGLSAIGYGLLGRGAPAALSFSDDLINIAQIGAAFDRKGLSGFLEGLGTLVGAKTVRGISEGPGISPAIGPALEFGTQQAIPMALSGERE